jgi:hypothetical protein
MELYLKKLSGLLFYTLGLSFFAMYFADANEYLGILPEWWFEVFDLPLALAAILYGGTSLHSSLRTPDNKAVISGVLVSIILLAVFGMLFVFNSWVPLGFGV